MTMFLLSQPSSTKETPEPIVPNHQCKISSTLSLVLDYKQIQTTTDGRNCGFAILTTDGQVTQIFY